MPLDSAKSHQTRGSLALNPLTTSARGLGLSENRQLINKLLVLSELSLRACLFFEARRWRHYGDDPGPESLAYWRELVGKIRASVEECTPPGRRSPSLDACTATVRY